MLKSCLSAFLTLALFVLRLSPAPEAPVCEPRPTGTFLQAWYCADWDADRWHAETAWMKEAGMDYLILQSLASKDAGGNWTVYYASALPVFKGAAAGNVLPGLLRSCKAAGIKVFLGLADFSGWWGRGGFAKDYAAVCEVMAQMQRELWETYAPDYADTLYGWYFPPEIDNIPQMKLSVGRIAKGLNMVLRQATALDPAMPVMLSPFFSEKLAVPSVLATLPMWQAFFAKAEFRPGDIFCPQDAVGAGYTKMKHIEKVWRMYALAVEGCGKGVRLWANCENFTSLPEGNVPAPAERFARQTEIAARYAENIVCFSMNHYCSPFAAPEAYREYMQNGG